MAFEESVGFILFGLMFTFAYIAVNMDRKNNFLAALQILFLFMSVYVGVVAVAFGIDIAGADASAVGILSGLYNIIVYLPIVAAGLFIMMFFFNVLTGNKKEKDEGD